MKIQIEIANDFINFNCDPYYRLFPVPNTIEYAYTLSNGSYNAKVEKNLRLHCTWSNNGKTKKKHNKIIKQSES
jgi:hypothetical protein